MQNINSEIIDIASAKITITKPIKLPVPFYDATMGPFDSINLNILTLTDRDGNKEDGVLNGMAIPYLVNILLPLLLKTPECSYAELIKKLFWSVRNEGFRGNASVALGQLDAVLHSLVAKRKDLTLREYFGSDISAVTVYASGGSAMLSKEDLVREMRSYVDEGYTILKMKIGRGGFAGFDEDIDRIKAVRKAVGDKIALSVDANQGLELDEAIKAFQKCEDLNLAWFEEPLQAADLDSIAKLCSQTSIPVSYGESERSGKVIPSLLAAGIDHLQVIPGYITTMGEWLQAAASAQKINCTFSSGGYSQFSCHWNAIAGRDAFTEYLIPIISHYNPFYSVKPKVENGKFILTDLPGIGVEIHWDYIHKNALIHSQKPIDKL